MKITRSFVIDEENYNYLKAQGNMSEYLNSKLTKERKVIDKTIFHIVVCDKCGCEYSSGLSQCPMCAMDNLKKNKEEYEEAKKNIPNWVKEEWDKGITTVFHKGKYWSKKDFEE